MRPISVEFGAFGPYVGKERVDFEDLASKGLFLICGKTGTGKTTILDAMTFALFGKSSGNGRNEIENMRCTNAKDDTPTFVRFEFENKGEIYRFERRLEKKRVNFSASFNAERREEDGSWTTLFNNAKKEDLNKKAEEIIGLDYEQFRQIIVLPQGQFERFLTSNSEDKEKILTNIFGETKWQEIANRMYEEAAARRDALKGKNDRIQNSLADEGCASVAELDNLVERFHLELEELEKNYLEANVEATANELQKLLLIINRFEELDKAEAKYNSLLDKQAEAVIWKKQAEDAARAEKLRTHVDEVNRLRREKARRKIEENKAAEDVKNKEAALKNISELLENHLKGAEANSELATRKIEYESKLHDYEGIDVIQNNLKNVEKRLDAAEKDVKKSEKQVAECNELYISLNMKYDQVRDEHSRLRRAFIASYAGILAKDLVDNEACPVCGSTTHPAKAECLGEEVTKAMVDSKEKEEEEAREAMNKCEGQLNSLRNDLESRKTGVNELSSERAEVKGRFDAIKQNMIEGIATLEELKAAILDINNKVQLYENKRLEIENNKNQALELNTAAKSALDAAISESLAVDGELKEALDALSSNMKEAGFENEDAVTALLMKPSDFKELTDRIASYETSCKMAKDGLDEIKAELSGKNRPSREEYNEKMASITEKRNEYTKRKTILNENIERLTKKLSRIKSEGEGIEEAIHQADNDIKYIKQLRGDSGTSLQRYVLGIRFTSVIEAANEMLKLVHGGRYSLFRTDENSQGGRKKKGLELKVYDSHSDDKDGRFVNTLSGGEKFLVSLALSIGMSTVAQKSGIRIEALFIDEGFGSLDEDSITNAMDILNSIRDANGLVGIISHVQILQDKIGSKIMVKEAGNGSHLQVSIG